MTPTHGDVRTRLLLHVVTEPRPTVQSAATAANTSVGNAHRHLTLLRGEGLVTWENGKRATLRPLVRPVPFGDDAA